MIFIDASAFVSIIAREADATQLATLLKNETVLACSAISMWETMAALCKNYQFSIQTARNLVADYTRDLNIQCVPIGAREYQLAALAYAEFGKGRHPAALNMGDCFAYACAKAHDAKLLYKGGDFALTDIAAA